MIYLDDHPVSAAGHAQDVKAGAARADDHP